MGHYVLSCGAKGNYYTLRHIYLKSVPGCFPETKDAFVKKLTTDYEESLKMAREYAGNSRLVIDAPDSLSKMTRRSDVDWSNEPVDFGKHSGMSARAIAENHPSYFTWVIDSGSKKWSKIFRELAEAEYPSLLPEAKALAGVEKFKSEYPDVAEWLEANKDSDKEFFRNLYRSYISGDGLRDGAIRIVREAIAEAAAPKFDSNHVGVVGKRDHFHVKIKRVKEFEAEGYTYYSPTVTKYAHTMIDRKGNVIVYIGTARLGDVGDVIMMKATVKAHDSYNGVKQTKVSRPSNVVIDAVNSEAA